MLELLYSLSMVIPDIMAIQLYSVDRKFIRQFFSKEMPVYQAEAERMIWKRIKGKQIKLQRIAGIQGGNA